jgi:hypothetical protein
MRKEAIFEGKIGFMASMGFARIPAETIVSDLQKLGYNAFE